MKNLTLSLFVCLLGICQAFAQADCSSAIIICGNTLQYNPNGVGNKLEQLACGGIEHNSIWFAFQAKANGKLNFVIRPTNLMGTPTVLDVDWSLYKLAGSPNNSNCDNKTQLSCNFAGNSTVFGIPGATGMATPNFVASQFNPGIDVVAGTWYALQIDQFSNTTPSLFSVQFTGNPESSNLNSTAGIFDNRPDFSVNSTNGCSGAFSFTSSSIATSGIASYSWDFGDGTTSTSANPTKTFINNGTYNVRLRITDNNGCSSEIRKQLVVNKTPPSFNSTGIFVTPSCSDINNGTITVTSIGSSTPGVSGGIAPYQYELVSPSAVIRPAQSSSIFNNLPPGGYVVKVTDVCGESSVSNSITLSQVSGNTIIGLGIGNTQPSCNGSATGTATIFASGTVPPYTMALVNSSPVTTAALPAVQRDPISATYYTTFTGLLPGSYTVEAFDACGRVRRATFTLTASSAPTANTVASPSCATSPTGTLTVTATAATGLSGSGSPGNFQYALVAPSPTIRAFQTSSVFENLYPGTYTIAVKDACGNIGTTTSTISTAVSPNFGTSFTTASCPNGNTGTIEVQNGTTAGGGSPYTYALVAPSPITVAPQNNNTFENLPPGTYTIRMTDVCNTAVTTTATVAASTAPSFTTSVTASCSNADNGSITITPSASSIGPYEFELISPGAAIRNSQGSNIANSVNSIFTELKQGSYTIRMKDGCNTYVTATASITGPSSLAFPSGSITTPSCAGSGTGRIVVPQPNTGIGDYQFELISPSQTTRSSQTSRIFDGLPAGNYTVKITDACGTQVDNSGAPLTVAVASAPTFSVTNTASCSTASGTIICLAANANQGGGPYLFALISPSPVIRANQTSPIFTALSAGTYTIQITDQCGQTGTTTTTIATAGAFTPTAGGSVVSCNGNNYNAQIVVTAPQNYTTGGPIPSGSGGGPYTYALYDATNTTLLAGPQSSNVFSTVVPLAGNPTHTIRVTDACGNVGTTTVFINPPTALTAASISVAASSCSSSNVGVIRVTSASSGGFPPYRYSLINNASTVVAAAQTGTTFTNVPANATGYYVVTTDACGNTVTSGSILAFPVAADPTGTVSTIPSCSSSNTGSITVSPSVGTTNAGGITGYALYDAANSTLIRSLQASSVFTGLGANTYTVRITDQCGNVGSVSATISNTISTLTSSGNTFVSCSGGNSGVITASSSGGALPITYSLVNNTSNNVVVGYQSENIFPNLPQETYVIQAKDACGTIATSSPLTVSATNLSPTITTTSALDCSGNASISAYGGGGNGGTYTYALCSGAGCTSFSSFSNASTFTVNTSGTYRISVKDRCGVETLSNDVIITLPPKPTISNVVKTNTCGTTPITVNFTGISNTVYYSLNGSNFSSTLSNAADGCNAVRVADFNAGTYGCASDAYNFSVISAPSLTAATSVNWTVNCATSSVLPTLANASGNTGCVADGNLRGVKLIACTNCSGTADAIGTIRPAGQAFNLVGASAATFAPVVYKNNTAICEGNQVTANFSTFSCGSLPVSFLGFSGKRLGIVNTLKWETANEQYCAGFEIQRSEDGNRFVPIGFEKSKAVGGFSNSKLSYTYNDTIRIQNVVFYRLRQVDINGNSSYSKIISLSDYTTHSSSISLYPNPANKQLNVSLIGLAKQTVDLVVMDATGKPLLKKNKTIGNNQEIISFDINALPNGMYFVYVMSNTNLLKLYDTFIKQ